MSAQKLDLGRVVGMSVFEIWQSIPGNEEKSFNDMLDEIERHNIVDIVNENEPRSVSSNAVYNFTLNLLTQLGLLGETIYNGKAVMKSAFSFNMGQAVDPREEAFVQHEDGETSWTISPKAGHAWSVGNGGSENNTLIVELPDSSEIGDEIIVSFLAPLRSDKIGSVTIQSGGVLESVGGEEIDSCGQLLRCSFSSMGWLVSRSYFERDTSSDIITYSARIIYSGANRTKTSSESYETTISWSGTLAEIQQTKTVNLRSDIFRSLFPDNVMTFKGWTTNANSSTVEYEDGDSVQLTNGQTLTVYPLYNSYTFNVALGVTQTTRAYSDNGNEGYHESAHTVNPANWFPNYTGQWTCNMFYWIQEGNDKGDHCGCVIGSGNYERILTAVYGQALQTNVTKGPYSGAVNVKFRCYAYGKDSRGNNSSAEYQAYISQITIN